jgi:hypothetical protein
MNRRHLSPEAWVILLGCAYEQIALVVPGVPTVSAILHTARRRLPLWSLIGLWTAWSTLWAHHFWTYQEAPQ